MPSPIEIMIDRSGLKCTRCGTPRETGCKCWEQIKLHCPGCGATKKATRVPSDPAGAKVVELACPKCWDKVMNVNTVAGQGAKVT